MVDYLASGKEFVLHLASGEVVRRSGQGISLCVTWDMIVAYARLLALLWIVLQAARSDLKTCRIPNSITYSGILVGLLFGIIEVVIPHSSPIDTEGVTVWPIQRLSIGFVESLLGMGIAFVFMFWMWKCGTTGGGDVKLVAALGAFLGVRLSFSVVIWAYLTAGIGSLSIASWQHGLIPTALTAVRCVGRMFVPHSIWGESGCETAILRRRIPMGGYFLLGTLMVLFGGSLL